MADLTNLTEITSALVENNQNMLAIQQEISSKVAVFQKQLDAAQEQDKQLRALMLEAMEKAGHLEPYEDENIKVTYIPPQERRGVDLDRLQLEQPDIYEEYLKPTRVRSQVRIKIK